MNTKALYAKARRGLAQGDAGYWEAAEAMSQLAERGESNRAIATELGLGSTTVLYYLRVFTAHRGEQNKPPWSEAMAEARNRGEQRIVPKTPEKRAELAADLLKDKAVADAPIVREAANRAAERRGRQAAQEWNKENNIPTRTQKARDDRRQSVVVNKDFWRDLLYNLKRTRQLLREAAGELDRTGLPNSQAGDILKEAAGAARDAESFRKRATVRAVGESMNDHGAG